MGNLDIDAAKKKVKVPERKWANKADVKEWASQLLAGAPPKLQAVIPPGNVNSGEPADWGDIKEGHFANRYVEIVSDPPGLIITTSTGSKFVPRANPQSLMIGANPQKAIDSISIEKQLREFVKTENTLMNQDSMESHKGKVAADGAQQITREFYEHGKRIARFVEAHPTLTKDKVWKELEKWGTGKAGYSRHHHEYATYMFEWLGDIPDSHDIFKFSTTRVQHIIMGTTKSDEKSQERNRLLEAMVHGPLKDMSDDEFSWVVGKRNRGVPIDEVSKERLKSIGLRIRQGVSLERIDLEAMGEIIQKAKVPSHVGKDTTQ